ncbi:unnamed protein product [Effrenium voratum]|uniref:Glycoside hydrolase family 5 domain-containing protein n=1 Tax=Effrenium voratum TaxID=2562239 RepID=A0AA36JII0_9DINO|nr:unnamed protein product [Effrenium voratum]CAJ1444808.1 unnamed protein product [Effrenium voratum]
MRGQIMAAVLLFATAERPRDAHAAPLVPLHELPLRTKGRFVVGQSGRRVMLACVNWYGASQRQMVNNGLDTQPIQAFSDRIAALGFNCVRLPFSLEMVLRNTTVPNPEALAANPELLGLSPIQVFDKTVEALTKAGLLVVLNNHVSSAGWCCSGSDGEGLWYTERFSEEDWLRGLRLMTRRYKGDARVMGFDLRNEVRADGIRLPTWGSGDPWTDWAIAAVKGAREVLRERPDLLIVVSGIHFGMRLSEVPSRPVHEEVPELRNRTVYTTHFYYGWSFDMMAFDMLARHIPVLICFTCWLWFLLAADRSARAARAPGPRQSEASPGWELCAAAALLALQACLFLIGEILGQSCGHIHIVSPPAFVVLSSWLFQASYLIWARILLSYTLVLFTNTKEPRGYSPVQGGSREAVEDPSLAAMPQDEMLQVEAPPVPKSRAPVGLAILRAACRTCTLCCGSDALVQPLRERQRLSAVAPLAFLTALLVVGGKCGSYENFRGELDACLGPLLSGEGVTPAPVWLSEFGTDVRDNYFNNIIRYMKENELDFAYWSINGRKRFNESETYGLLQDDNFAVRHPWKLEMLHSLLGAK